MQVSGMLSAHKSTWPKSLHWGCTMKRLLLVIPLLFACSTAAHASPCALGSLATYDTAGFSCSYNGLTFSNFTYSETATGGAILEPASDVFTVPCPGGPYFEDHPGVCGIMGSGETGILFLPSEITASHGWTVSAGQTEDATISFTVTCISSHPCATGTSLPYGIAGTVGIGGGATASVLETLSNGCELSVSSGSPNSPSCSFAGTTNLNVSVSFALQSGDSLCCEAYIPDLPVGFSQTPEPSSLLLLGSGFMALGVFLRRRST